MAESEEIQARIAVALEHAERICAKARATRLESGPQSEAQWLGDVAEDMSDEEVAAWAEVL